MAASSLPGGWIPGAVRYNLNTAPFITRLSSQSTGNTLAVMDCHSPTAATIRTSACHCSTFSSLEDPSPVSCSMSVVSARAGYHKGMPILTDSAIGLYFSTLRTPVSCATTCRVTAALERRPVGGEVISVRFPPFRVSHVSPNFAA